MKTEERPVLYLVAHTTKERDLWRDLLEPYAWADGEFGMLCTDAAFRECCLDAHSSVDIPAFLREQVRRCSALLDTGFFGDVCLENGLAASCQSSGS